MSSHTRNSKQPLLVIIGATGTGKSQLAVDLALRYNGEVVNGDSLQLYHGLPIITNKIRDDEKEGIPHHLLGCVNLEEPTWQVGRFVNEALKIIAEIRARGKLPILVGGTHYYTQSLLFNESLVLDQRDHNANSDAEDAKQVEDSDAKWPILSASAAEMLVKLKEVDPVMAARWHPNDTRKIRRSLEIWLQTGRKASDVYAEQAARRARAPLRVALDDDNQSEDQQQSEGDSIPPDNQQGLRFPTLILWPHVPRHILTARLDARVNKMLSRGLLLEATSLYKLSTTLSQTTGNPVDETRGIYAAVGYKEFKPYLERLATSTASPSSQSHSTNPSETTTSSATDPIDSQLQALLGDGIERTKGATRRYAKSQLRWIRIKLAHALAQANAAAAMDTDSNKATMYILDASDPSPAVWNERVLAPACAYTSIFLSQHQQQPHNLPDSPNSPNSHSTQPNLHNDALLTSANELPDPSTEAAKAGPEFLETLKPLREDDVADGGKGKLWQVKKCEVCGISVVREEEWERHLGSQRHKRAVRGVEKRRARDVFFSGRREGGAVGDGGGRGDGDAGGAGDGGVIEQRERTRNDTSSS